MDDSAAKEVNDLRRALLALLPTLAFTDAAQAQDAALVQPRAYRVAFENDKLRVLEFNSKPGMGVCGSGVHSHPAHLTIALSPIKARGRILEGKESIAENKLGDVWWGEPVTHEVENISGKNTRLLIVELKPLPTGKA